MEPPSKTGPDGSHVSKQTEVGQPVDKRRSFRPENPPNVSTQQDHRSDDSALSPSREKSTSFIDDVNPVVPEDVDTLMAQLMTQSSMHEREEVYNDLHGVADEVVETPEMNDEAMNRMKLELSKMFTEATAYREALAQDRSFVHSYKSLLCFLRAERFDPVRAATRLTKFYSLKMKGFGLEKLTKEIY